MLESRIAIHGNLDAEENEARDDCFATKMLLVRLILCVETCLGLLLDALTLRRLSCSQAPSHARFM